MDTKNLKKAKKLLEEENITCAICREENIYTSTERGVKPLLMWLDSKTNLSGFSAADKVVGGGAAFLYVLLGVEAVYAPVMSKGAIDTLEKYGIHVECDLAVEHIINRKGTGICPMEDAVRDIEEPREALKAIQKRLEEL